jgi:hypothetical protein
VGFLLLLSVEGSEVAGGSSSDGLGVLVIFEAPVSGARRIASFFSGELLSAG